VTVLLANARHVKNVPGRKTDVRDCEWIAQLLRCDLVDGSFVPPRHIREARDLTRYRRSLVEEGAREKNRVQKILEDANIKLGSVLSDVFGASGQKMLEKIVAGEGTPEEIANLAKGRLRPKVPQLAQALNGVAGEHHRFLIKQMLAHMEYIEQRVMEVDAHIVAHFASEREELELLDGIPGVGESAAAAIVALAHRILVIVYHVLKKRTPYRELGGGYFDALHHGSTKKYLTKRFRDLGYDVKLEPRGEAALSEKMNGDPEINRLLERLLEQAAQ
jgi:transposase